MGPLTSQLIDRLEVLAEILSTYEETHWLHQIELSIQSLKENNFGGISRLLGLFGGMGSLNDLTIHPLNGHKILDDEIDDINDQLRDLLSNIYDLANKVNRDAEIG